jgi:hypothetical protein
MSEKRAPLESIFTLRGPKLELLEFPILSIFRMVGRAHCRGFHEQVIASRMHSMDKRYQMKLRHISS